MRIARTFLAIVVALGAGALAAQPPAAPAMPAPFPLIAPPPPSISKPNPAIAALQGYFATIRTNLGDLVVEFEPESAPNTVHNFIKLAERGFYDGQRFYCVFRDRMILAGDPTGTGTGDVGYTIPYEAGRAFHAPGSLATDRLPPGPNSGSRFFIDLRDQKHLDGNYTVFGRITTGLDVAQRIGALPTQPNGGRPVPLEDAVIEEIIVSKKKQAQPEKETKKE